MVPLTQRNLCSSALNIAQSLALSPGDQCLSVMPLFHIHGLIGAGLSTIASGGSLACPGIFRAPAFSGWLKKYQPTWYTAAPSMHSAVLARADQLSGISSSHQLRFIRSCSAPLPQRVISGLEDFFGVPVVEAYGMTEAAHQMACNPLPPGRRKPGSVGIPTGTSIAIMNGTDTLLPPGTEGEIVVRGANVMGGYVANPEANAEAFADGWFRTGDQGELDADGYLFITGRIKEIINRGGEKISPREVDEVLLAHPAVADAVAFALPDAHLGEDVGAAIVLKPGPEALDARSLLNFAQTRLAPFKLPRQVLFVTEIPKGPTGKPQRVGLAKRLGLEEESGPTSASAPTAAPRSPTELALLRLCREAFQIDTFDIDDDFFESGGDSLSALGLLLEIERHWNVTVTIADMLAAPTVAKFAKIIDQAASSREGSQLAIIQAGGSRPPFFCVGAGPRYFELARLLGPEQPFLGPVHPHPSKLPHPCRIEDVATHHVRIIRAAQPRGPYFIGGWCNDGLVAYEIAQQLRALGEPVGLVVLFDTSFFSSRFIVIYASVRAGVQRVIGQLPEMIRQQRWSAVPGYLLGRLHSLGRLAREWLRYPYDRRKRVSLQEKGRWGVDTETQRRAAKEYRPSLYDGRVLLLRRSAQQSRWLRRRQDWSRLVRGGFDAYDIPGDHETIFVKPHVVVMAKKLAASLQAGQAGATASTRERSVDCSSGADFTSQASAKL
jgi:thioesterase domain-containing protein